MSAPVDVLAVLREYARDTGPFRVGNLGAAKLAAACAAAIQLIEVANRAAIAASLGDENRPGTIRNADLDSLRAALARVRGEA